MLNDHNILTTTYLQKIPGSKNGDLCTYLSKVGSEMTILHN